MENKSYNKSIAENHTFTMHSNTTKCVAVGDLDVSARRFWKEFKENSMKMNSSIIKRRFALSCFQSVIVLVVLSFSSSLMATELYMLQYGVWGLSLNPDPFKNKHPVVSYLPPGTILFDKAPGPSYLRGYITVLTQYGHKLHIKEKIKISGSAGNTKVYSSLSEKPPTNNIIFHESILCLGQSNRISLPPSKCLEIGDDTSTTLPVGKGWIYSFSESSKGKRWLDLRVTLDNKTTAELIDRGLNPVEANFDITKDELVSLERKGHLTLLDKKMPTITFTYQTNQPAFIPCGVTTITEKMLKASMGIKVSAEVSGEVPFWATLFTGIKAKLGLTTEGEVSADSNTKWTISVNTEQSSYLYYTVIMRDSELNKVGTIFVEKIFECKQSPNKEPGDRMQKVTFEIERPGDPDVEIYEFDKHDEYLNVSDELLNHHPRPVFISVNSSEQHSNALRKILEKQVVDISLAHFMLSHVNNTCGSRKREKCKRLVDVAE